MDTITRTIVVPLTHTRSIVLRRHRPGHWQLFNGAALHEIKDDDLFNVPLLDSKCGLRLNNTQRTYWLRGLCDARRRAKVKIKLTKVMRRAA